MQSLSWLLVHFPAALRVVRGIDICTDELGVPTWVMVPLFRFLVDAGNHASAVNKQVLGVDVPPLRLTTHVGEDFVHLLGGLRRVDEAVEYLGLREGDRIGHGVALGVNAMEWSARTARVPQTQEDRLFDLVWQRRFCGQTGAVRGNTRQPSWENEIIRLSSLIFGEALTVQVVEQLYDDLHQEALLRCVGFPHGGHHLAGIDPISQWPGPPDQQRRLALLHRYLTSRGIFGRGHRLEWVNPSEDGEILEEVQQSLRQKVGSRNITVEVNPSSNLLIGNLGDVRNHPLWRLQPPPVPSSPHAPHNTPTASPPVSVCIGSDDPITFATTLLDEYQLVYDSLVLAGLSSDEARGWIDSVRDNGLRARFTLPGSYDDLSASIPLPITYDPIL